MHLTPEVSVSALTVFLQGCNSAPAPQTLGNEQRMVIRVATDYRMDSIGYQQLQEFAKRVQEKCGFVYQYTEKDVKVSLLNEVRDDNISKLTKEVCRLQMSAGYSRPMPFMNSPICLPICRR